MGIVYLATDKNLGRQVAVKVLHPHLLRHENLKQRFRREARMHAKLMHPNIVTLLSLYEDGEHMALVMEMIQGKNLKEHLLENTSLGLEEKLRIATDVLTGLEAAHQFGMVHRDLKPANVLVSTQGDVKLLDFGLAKPEQGEDDLTQSGATVGSFRYMAPEQILNNPIDARTDLYAFGILLFYMTVGKLPFNASSNGGEFEIMEKQVREPAPIPHKENSKIPKSLSNLILKLLEKNKSNRPASAIAVKEELNLINEQLHLPKTKHRPAKSTPITFRNESNVDIAKQWLKHGQKRGRELLKPTSSFLNTYCSGLTGIALLFVLLGILVIAILNISEKTDLKPTDKPLLEGLVESKSTPTKQVVITTENSAIKTPPQTAGTPKVITKPSATKKPSIEPITFKRVHQVTRSDETIVNSKRNHEFRSGQHTFFPELENKGWFKTLKRGETKVEFKNALSLSKIVLHKASVGRADFKNGYIYLEVQAPDSKKWKTLFERKNDDVDVKITIRNVQKHLKLVKAVRIRFKTPNPITIGPIDLIR